MPTATQSGSVDTGLLRQLQVRSSLSAAEFGGLLNRRSGLESLARAEESGGFSWYLKDRNRAVQYFCYQAKKFIGAYLAALGDADALVFCSSVAESHAGVHREICKGLASVGILLNEAANSGAIVAPGKVVDISDRRSHIRVLLVGADEQAMIAQLAVATLQEAGIFRREAPEPQRGIPVAVSAYHVHLTKEHIEQLFGAGANMTKHADLSQPGHFSCEEKVALVGPRGRIERVRVLGPYRKASQVEVSRTEAFKLDVNPPVRASGSLEDTPGIQLEGPAGTVELDRGVICALRHIHITPDDALEFRLRDKDLVSVRILDSERSLAFGSVLVRVHPQSGLEMHIDTDEGNAAGIPLGATCYLESIDERSQAG